MEGIIMHGIAKRFYISKKTCPNGEIYKYNSDGDIIEKIMPNGDILEYTCAGEYDPLENTTKKTFHYK